MARDLSSDIDRIDWSGDPLDRLTELRWTRDYLEVLIEEAVAECRSNGRKADYDEGQEREVDYYSPISWTRIGDALKISRQGARQRYGTA